MTELGLFVAGGMVAGAIAAYAVSRAASVVANSIRDHAYMIHFAARQLQRIATVHEHMRADAKTAAHVEQVSAAVAAEPLGQPFEPGSPADAVFKAYVENSSAIAPTEYAPPKTPAEERPAEADKPLPGTRDDMFEGKWSAYF
jgi:hypothetical protein